MMLAKYFAMFFLGVCPLVHKVVFPTRLYLPPQEQTKCSSIHRKFDETLDLPAGRRPLLTNTPPNSDLVSGICLLSSCVDIAHRIKGEKVLWRVRLFYKGENIILFMDDHWNRVELYLQRIALIGTSSLPSLKGQGRISTAKLRSHETLFWV